MESHLRYLDMYDGTRIRGIGISARFFCSAYFIGVEGFAFFFRMGNRPEIAALH
ncbi:hypothetical protein HBI24_193720 [Parastagonospora nodorum]|nr:hypothetical protein HBI76_043680 [Parastagonospora nodorum]KAH5574670.1 hypothetical protein HBI24_193720 [Parastagonospora nodorum]KAH6335350.1 hypothetical protein HBI36_231810 [Parastagonospora nodorum]KAH6358610.1 hypothetical protein HBI37_000820 [Parastagonospora nodorum]